MIRVVGLNQTANLTQTGNLDLRRQVVLETLDQVEALYREDPFGLDTEQAIMDMKEQAGNWYAGYRSFGKLLETSLARADIQFIKTEILPIQQQVAAELNMMDRIVHDWSVQNLSRVEDAAGTVMIELWVLALVLLVFVILVYSLLSGTLLKPIADLSDDLAVDIHNPDSQPLEMHAKGKLFKSSGLRTLSEN